MLYIVINTGQKICRTKFLPTRPGGEIGKNFLLTKISGSTICDKFLQAAVLSLVEKGIVNKNAVVAFGISHGGFLTTQLVVQHPVS